MADFTEREELIDFISANREHSPELSPLSAVEVRRWALVRPFVVLYAAAEQIAERGKIETMPECPMYIDTAAYLGHI